MKQMKKLLSLFLSIVILFSLFSAIPISFSTEFEMGVVGDFLHYADTSFGTQYIQNADGSVTMWYGTQDVTWANLGLTYAGALTQGDYTVDIDFIMPETNSGCTQGNIVFALGIDGVSWSAGNCDLIVKIIDYSTHPTVGLGTEANFGKFFEMFTFAGGNVAVVNCNTAATYADCAIQDYGTYNHFRAVVSGGLCDVYLNNVLILDNYALGGAGTGFCFGTNGDSGQAGEGHATFKNLTITAGSASASYFPSETVDLPFDVIPQCSGNTDGTISVAANGDITLGCNTGWWGSAGIVTTEKVPIDGISITFNKSVFTDVSPNGYFGILVSKNKPTTYSVQMMTRSYAPDVKASQSLMVCVNGQSASEWGPFTIEGTTCTISHLYGGNYDDTTGDDCTVTFGPVYTKWVDVSGIMKAQKSVRVYVNGECLYSLVDLNAYDIDEDWYVPNWVERPVEINVSKVVDADNMVYLTLTAQGYGGSGGTVVVKDISYGAAASADFTMIGARAVNDPALGIQFAATIDKGTLYDVATVDHYGTLIIPADRLDDPAQLFHTESGDITSEAYPTGATAYLDVVANDVTDGGDYIAFTGTLTENNAPAGWAWTSAQTDVQFVARSYIAYTDGTIVYAEPVVRCYDDVVISAEFVCCELLNGHTFGDWVTITAPTCTAAGEKTHTCSICNAVENETIPATGHTPDAAVVENNVDPTCTAAGHYDSVVYCAVCGAEISRETINVLATGHTYGDWVTITAPTCTATGLKDRFCTNCGSAENHTYEVILGSYTWEAAKTACENLGGHLVTITSAEEQAFVESIANSNNCYIGLYRDSSFNWYWVTGEPVNYTNWDAGEPNNFNDNQTYAKIISYYWDDIDNNSFLSATQGFICEYDGVVIPALGHTYGDWENDDDAHWHACCTCGDIADYEEHVYDDDYDADCNVCGAIRTVPHIVIPSDPQIVAANTTVCAGETVQVSFEIRNAVPLKSILLNEFTYDDSVLEFISGQWTVSDSIISSWDPATMTAATAFASNTDVNGMVFTLTFQVKNDAIAGSYAVGCSITAKTKVTTEEFVEIYSVPGAVEIVQKGDVNGDGEVDSDDAIYLLYYTLLPDWYPINQNADFDGSGEVDSDDAIYLLYYTLLPDWYPLN